MNKLVENNEYGEQRNNALLMNQSLMMLENIMET